MTDEQRDEAIRMLLVEADAYARAQEMAPEGVTSEALKADIAIALRTREMAYRAAAQYLRLMRVMGQ